MKVKSTSATTETTADPILLELREQTAWLRLMVRSAVLPVMKDELKDPKARAAYVLSDGSRTTREVAAEVGAGKSSVARWWARWTRLALAVQQEDGRVRTLVPDVFADDTGGMNDAQ